MSESIRHRRIVQTGSVFFNVLLIILSFFMMKLGQFLIVPFLAIYLSHFSLSPLTIGIIIASGQFCYSMTCLCTGHWSDRFNPQSLLMLSLLGAGIAYEFLATNQFLIGFIVLNILIALLRALFDTVSKTIVATHVDESHRSYAFGLRYVVVNLAAALGPLLGTRYAAEHSMYLFHQIAYCYFFTSFGFLLCCSKKQSLDSSKKLSFPNNSSLRGTFQLIVANPSLKRLFLISFICYGLYSQITSSLAQYIMKQFADGVEIYSNLLILNAITCVVLQIFIGPLLKRVSYMLLAAIGLALMALGFLGFCFAQNSFMLSCSMLILSIGEVIFFPLNDVILAKIAPAHLIGSCYGVLNASTMGLAVGPILGGAIYQLGDYSVFIICAMISLCTIILYKKLVLAHP